MEDITVSGIVTRRQDNYVITADDGTEYILSAIMPWEALPPDFGSGDYALHVGKRMIATGSTDGQTIWRAVLIDLYDSEN